MKRFFYHLKRFLDPGAFLTFLLILFSTAGLYVVFSRGLEQSALAYAVYPIAFYSLLAVVLRSIPCFRKVHHYLHTKPLIHRYLTDKAFKATVSIFISFGITLLYSVLKAVTAALYHSPWMGAFALYYILLGIARFLLLRQITAKPSRKAQYTVYGFCGILLFLLTIILFAMSLYTILVETKILYPGLLIYAAALFTFYQLGMAIANLIRYRKSDNPAYVASKIFSFSTSLVSVFFLQTAMFASFGENQIWEKYMNLATISGVSGIILVNAVMMIKKAMAELHT